MSRVRFFHVVILYLMAVLPAASGYAAAGQQPFFVCTDFHCDIGKMVTLPQDQWQSVRALFGKDGTPAQERENIRQAIALMEQDVGPLAGTWRDTGGNYTGVDGPGQLDCISESRNTTTYLQLMAGDGLLRWHEVGKRRVRKPWIFSEHWTAVIIDSSDGRSYAVDSWFYDNGQPPVILPLNEWLKGHDRNSAGAAKQ